MRGRVSFPWLRFGEGSTAIMDPPTTAPSFTIVSCSNGGCCLDAGRRHADPPPGWDGASPGHLYAAWSFPAPALTVRPHVLALTVAARRLVHAAAYYRMRFESSVMGQHMVRGCVAPLKRDLHE